jgi:hypothetical protein
MDLAGRGGRGRIGSRRPMPKKENMPLELQIIRAREFIRLGVDGHLDLASSCEMLRQLARACRLRGIDQALLDVREVHPGATPMLTADDLASLVNTFREVGFSNQQRLALLYSDDPHCRARMFASMSTQHGWNVKASEDFEETLLWLSEGQGEEVRKEAGEQEIPLRSTTRTEHSSGTNPASSGRGLPPEVAKTSQ